MRIGRQGTRDFEQTLLAERQAACRQRCAIGDSNPLELRLRLEQQPRLLGPVEPRGSAKKPELPRRCAPSATFSSTLIFGCVTTCWKVRDMPRPAIVRGGEHVDAPAGEVDFAAC